MNKLFLFLMFFSLIIVSCTNEDKIVDVNQFDKNTYFKENVAFVDARMRSLGEEGFVKEVVLKDFSLMSKLPSSIGFQDGSFVDNGLLNDVKAGDGIYTSIEVYSFTSSTPNFKKDELKSVLEEVIIDKSFKFREQLNSSLKQIAQDVNNPNLEERGPVATIECDLEFGTKGCLAQKWGWCDSCCVTVSNCRGKIGWE